MIPVHSYLRLFMVAPMLLLGCSSDKRPAAAPFIPVSTLESEFGPLITAANHQTADQLGTGTPIGFFRDSAGTIWGFPLSVTDGGKVLGCAPSEARGAPVTDSYPAGDSIIAALNQPTGWRGGTGPLELVLRDPQGSVHFHAISGAHSDKGEGCWLHRQPEPVKLLYYRLAPAEPSKHPKPGN